MLSTTKGYGAITNLPLGGNNYPCSSVKEELSISKESS